MYVRVLLLSVVLGLATAEVPKKIMHTMVKYNLLEKCWGQKNMVGYALGQHKAMEHCKQLSPMYQSGFTTLPGKPFQQTRPWPGNNNQAQNDMLLQELAKLLLPRLRNRRQAGGLLEADESDLQEFLGNLEDFKEGMQSKISNLTCVLTQMKILDANMQPNMYQYLTGVWQELDMSEPNIAIQEPEWVQKMKNSYTDCHDLAKAWPQKSLDRNELTKKYGREMVFFKCVDKMQVQNCAKFCIKQALELWYGKDDSDWTQYGLPRDKYDASLVSMMVLDEAATPEEEFVSDFFWSKPQ